MATRLTETELDEVSGVESPANEVLGFMVMKSAASKLDPEQRQELLKAVDRMESDFAVLYSALNACQQYMGDAPPEVQQLDAELAKALGDTAAALESLAATVAEVQKTQVDDGDTFRTVLESLTERVSNVEVAKQAVDSYDISPVTVQKDADPVARSTYALRSVLTEVASNPGRRVTIG
jgi:hypothetical protein